MKHVASVVVHIQGEQKSLGTGILYRVNKSILTLKAYTERAIVYWHWKHIQGEQKSIDIGSIYKMSKSLLTLQAYIGWANVCWHWNHMQSEQKSVDIGSTNRVSKSLLTLEAYTGWAKVFWHWKHIQSDKKVSNQCKSQSPHKTSSCTQFLVRQVGRPLSHQLQPRRLLHPAAGYLTHAGGILQENCPDDMRHFPGIRGRTKDLGGSSRTVGGIQIGIWTTAQVSALWSWSPFGKLSTPGCGLVSNWVAGWLPGDRLDIGPLTVMMAVG